MENHQCTQEHIQSPNAPTRAAPHCESPAPQHCLNKGKVRNAHVEVAKSLLELFSIYSVSTCWWVLIIICKKAKKWIFSAGGKSEILVRRKKEEILMWVFQLYKVH